MPEASWATHLVCSRTGEPAALDRPAFLSPAGAPYLVAYELDPARGERLRAALPGRPWTLWRYRELLPLADFDARVDLGEGGTPLICLRRSVASARVFVKEEAGNPTGSFKARGLSLAVNRARELGAPGVQLPSAGNAALALAAYAAAAGLPARVALPDDTPATVLERCRAHGAEVITAKGTLVEAARRLAELADPERPFWDLSTLKEPYRAEGKKTMGLELWEQFCGAGGVGGIGGVGGGGRLPDWIIYPTGGGTGIVGMAKAFDELERLGLIGHERPRFVVVQMAGCAPLVRAFEGGAASAEPWADPQTRVWGLRVPRAIGDFMILKALYASGGVAVAVAESRLPAIRDRVARDEGLLLGPEGAAAFAALEDLVTAGRIASGERVVVFQTGHPGNYARAGRV